MHWLYYYIRSKNKTACRPRALCIVMYTDPKYYSIFINIIINILVSPHRSQGFYVCWLTHFCLTADSSIVSSQPVVPKSLLQLAETTTTTDRDGAAATNLNVRLPFKGTLVYDPKYLSECVQHVLGHLTIF